MVQMDETMRRITENEKFGIHMGFNQTIRDLRLFNLRKFKH